MNRALLIYICTLYCFSISNAQNRSNIWLFGDSVKVAFNNQINPIASSGYNHSSEACASISDSSGQLLLFSGSKIWSCCFFETTIFNRQGLLLQNSANVFGNISVTNGQLFVPVPGSGSNYYLFTIGSNPSKLYYNKIDMLLDSGRGAIVQKNILLCDSIVSEQLAAVKHANGRDWWLISHLAIGSNEYLIYLITPSGISLTQVLPFGNNISSTAVNFPGELVVSQNGDKMAHALIDGNLQLFDFDRCTGSFSNILQLGAPSFASTHDGYYGCSFSPRGNYLYASYWSDSLFQFDLNAPDIAASRQLLATVPNTIYNFTFGQHALGENNKIYISIQSATPTGNMDSLETHLTVINDPDASGSLCNITPFSFSLNGRKTLWGLPNFANYNLGPISGSICDSLTVGLDEYQKYPGTSIYPNPSSAKFTVKLNNTNNGNFIISDFAGNIVQRGVFSGNTFNLDLEDVSSGIYILKIVNATYVNTVKLIKN
jgi:Secretion system C-terminal sorting domain